MTDLYLELAKLVKDGRPAAVATVIRVEGHTPRQAGAKMLIRADGTTLGSVGGGHVEHAIEKAALVVIREGVPRLVRQEASSDAGMCCGGTVEVFIEPVTNSDRLVLFGAGHVAVATARFATACGWSVVVVDPRETLNTPERFPHATRCVVEPLAYLDTLEPRSSDAFVIATPTHQTDQAILTRLAPLDVVYLGMLGSAAKAQAAKTALERAGVEPERIAAVATPIGLDIAAQNPEELGIAIVGELIRARRAPTNTKTTHGSAVGSAKCAVEATPSR